MTLYEQLKKVETDLEKMEVKKKELQDKRKELLKDIELEEARKKAEQNEKVMEIITENFGEVTDENFELFRQFMQRHPSGMTQN